MYDGNVVNLGVEIFGSEGFEDWLQKPSIGLGGEIPLDIYESEGPIGVIPDILFYRPIDQYLIL